MDLLSTLSGDKAFKFEVGFDTESLLLLLLGLFFTVSLASVCSAIIIKKLV